MEQKQITRVGLEPMMYKHYAQAACRQLKMQDNKNNYITSDKPPDKHVFISFIYPGWAKSVKKWFQFGPCEQTNMLKVNIKSHDKITI